MDGQTEDPIPRFPQLTFQAWGIKTHQHGSIATRCVCETQMPPAATKSNKGKQLYVLHFDPALPPGACDVTEV